MRGTKGMFVRWKKQVFFLAAKTSLIQKKSKVIINIARGKKHKIVNCLAFDFL